MARTHVGAHRLVDNVAPKSRYVIFVLLAGADHLALRPGPQDRGGEDREPKYDGAGNKHGQQQEGPQHDDQEA